MALTLGDSSTRTSTAGSGGDNNKGVRFNKDYYLISLNVLSGQFITLDLKPSMVELSYFEDIYSNSVSGQLFITEAHGLIEKMGMHGNEYIRMAFGKDDNPKIRIDRLFRIYKISPRQKTTGFDSEGYVIHFCSDELVLSEQYRVSKSYVDRKIHEIVNDVLKNYIKVPETKYNAKNIETTKGVYSFIVPNFKPFEAINWLALYAQSGSSGNVGCDMLFFENAEGYNFTSLQTLFKKDPYFTYQYAPKNLAANQYLNADKEVFNVLAYEVNNSFNVLEGITSGMFANRLMTIDTLLRRYEITDFNYMEYQKKATSLNGNPIVNNLQNRFGHALYETPQGVFKLTGTNKNQANVPYIKSRPEAVTKDGFTETVFSQRKSQISLANYTRLKFYIAGDPNLTVGTTVNFNMLTQDPASDKEPKTLDKYYSGKYLVTAVRHIVQVTGYTTVIEAVKDSVPTPYRPVDNQQPIFKNTVAGVKK